MSPRLPTNVLRASLARSFSTALAPTNPLFNESDGTPRIGPRKPRPFMGDTQNDAAQRARDIMSMLAEHPISSPTASSSNAAAGSATEEFSLQELSQSQFRFSQGDIYAPNDLTMEEFRTRLKNRRPVKDAFDVLGINPLTQYKNYNLLSEYVTSMGRIQHSRETGLRPVNQRRIAKAIRRAVGIGFLPSTHRHPEILKQMESNLANKLSKGPRR
ncbi:ribosomal protein S18 [Sphaerosporella brunnea]|uniref:Small ribosomal subunit protein bS18m n=1 Tax=Sphaerosporella brunnea TaxID=1250544 RepID=A0A5J5F3C2_9PEZI|nr:ribosomal protein S18 [Sphaerosporella brunnea]